MKPAEIFLARYDSTAFPYAQEIVSALQDGSARVSHDPDKTSPTNAAELLKIYEGRARHLSRFATEFAARLKADLEAFCDGLREKKDNQCRVWLIEQDPCYIYSIWEWAADRSFIGVIKAVDDRKISEAERFALWGEQKNA